MKHAFKARVPSFRFVTSVALSTAACLFGFACSESSEPTPKQAPVADAGRTTDAQGALAQARQLAAPSSALSSMLSPRPGAFEAEAGGWRVADGSGTRHVVASFGANARDAARVTSASGGDICELVLEGARPATAFEEAGHLVYGGVFDSTDFLVSSEQERLELFFLMHSKSSPSAVRWQVACDGGSVRDEGGGLAFLDAQGRSRFRILAPLAIDAAGTRRMASLRWKQGQLALELDTAGLEFPVLLDPVVTYSWSQATPNTVPTARHFHSMSSAPGGGVLLFGGDKGGSPRALGDLWRYDTNDWVALCGGCSATPSARYRAAMAYDSNRNVAVMFGGLAEGFAVLGDTWEFDGTNWGTGAVCTSCGPSARVDAAMAYDSANSVMLMVGGSPDGAAGLADAYKWTGGPGWTAVTVPAGLAKRRAAAMAFDESSSNIVLFGGIDGFGSGHLGDTWQWDGSTETWTQLCTTGNCGDAPALADAAMVFDSARDALVLFGGQQAGGTREGRTFEWNGSAWVTTVAEGSGPSRREELAMAYDRLNRVSVLFGGHVDATSFNAETWEYAASGNVCASSLDCDQGFSCEPQDLLCCQAGTCPVCTTCDGTNSGIACDPVPSGQADGTACSGSSRCNGSGTCLFIDGTACTTGTQCLSGRCVDGVCCKTDCGAACDVCNVSGDGTCTLVTAGQPGSPSCAPFLCNGTSANCPTTCTAHSDCATGSYCNGTVCTNRLAAGSACSGDDFECQTGLFCVDGRCCTSQCSGDCQSCNNGSGTCSSVTNGEDPDTCSGSSVCDASGACKLKTGQACTAAGDCALGFCPDGFCCGTSCSGGCEECSSTPGTCTKLADGMAGSGCGSYLCDGVNSTCPTSCTGDGDCLTTHYCSGLQCLAKKANGSTCSQANECTSNQCVDGRCCESPCSGVCQSCANTTGSCQAVNDAADADTCTGANRCDSSGSCRKAEGTACGAAAECATDQCADGVCCDTACAGACDSCDATPGTCTLDPAGSAGTPTCAPYACTGASSSCPTSCSNHDQCAANHFCNSTGQCQADKSVGEVCSDDRECQSNQNCVDGFCCDSACTGTCRACSAQLKGSGGNGTCGNIVDGLDPEDECAADPDPCVNPGYCDGNGACRAQSPATTPCGTSGSVCVGNAVEGELCDGAGSCGFSGNPVDCAPFVCRSGACGTTCAGASDCVANAFCNTAGICEVKKTLGTSCATAVECASGHCVDGACCDTACSGACDTCQATNGSCSLSSKGTPGGPTCTPYLCDGSNATCPATCATDNDCVSTHFCDGTTCQPRADVGQSCTSDVECSSGFCTDGVCCDRLCDAQCEACDQAGSEGVCSIISGAPHGGRTACVDQGDACGGSCDGQSTTCTYPTESTSCGEPSCTAGVAIASSCNGQGRCVASQTTNCGDYACGATECKTSCSVTEDCAQGRTCQNGECVPSTAECSQDRTTVIERDGSEIPCAPYYCTGGACEDSCTVSDDCVAGNVCSDGLCVQIVSDTTSEDDGGCGCRTAGGKPGTRWGAAWLLLAAGLLWRRLASGRPLRRSETDRRRSGRRRRACCRPW